MNQKEGIDKEEYPATLKCPDCGEEDRLDSRFCKQCGRWLVSKWKGIQFKKVRVQMVG